MMPTTFFAKKLLEFRQLSIIDGRRGRMEPGGIEKSITSFFLLICAHFLIREETKGRQL